MSCDGSDGGCGDVDGQHVDILSGFFFLFFPTVGFSFFLEEEEFQ